MANRGLNRNRYYVIAFVCTAIAFRLGIEIGRRWPDFPCSAPTTPEPYKVVYPIAKPTSYQNHNKAIVFQKEVVSPQKDREDIDPDLRLIRNNISRTNLKVTPPPTTPDYVQIKQADSMGAGDFLCGGSVIENSCAFYVDNLLAAKEVCDSFSGHCKGFVFNAMPPSADKKIQYMVFIKKRVDKMTESILMDFFVKSKYMSEIGWKFD
eukprot:TCONS_00035255-protein